MRVSASAANSNVADVASAAILMGTNSTYQYIGDVNSTTVVANPSCFDQTSQTPVQDCIPSDSPSHSIGTVTFSPDGSALFVGTGDGAHFNFTDKRALRSLQLNSMAGKIFRIDPITGQGLPSNPFYDGDPNSNRSKVYNLGLRNPFRFTIHPQTGIPYIGDVGWNSWEEINTGIGKNFGWPCYEGGPISSLPQGSYQYLSLIHISEPTRPY
jgi:glucose/arabinose dehydrogenase